jgi:hypothetical protein
MAADTEKPGAVDELEEYLAWALRDPEFRRLYERAGRQMRMAAARPLCINGHEYHRRSRARRRRRR